MPLTVFSSKRDAVLNSRKHPPEQPRYLFVLEILPQDFNHTPLIDLLEKVVDVERHTVNGATFNDLLDFIDRLMRSPSGNRRVGITDHLVYQLILRGDDRRFLHDTIAVILTHLNLPTFAVRPGMIKHVVARVFVREIFQIKVKAVDIAVPIFVELRDTIGIVVRRPDYFIRANQVFDRNYLLVCRFYLVHYLCL